MATGAGEGRGDGSLGLHSQQGGGVRSERPSWIPKVSLRSCLENQVLFQHLPPSSNGSAPPSLLTALQHTGSEEICLHRALWPDQVLKQMWRDLPAALGFAFQQQSVARAFPDLDSLPWPIFPSQTELFQAGAASPSLHISTELPQGRALQTIPHHKPLLVNSSSLKMHQENHSAPRYV